MKENEKNNVSDGTNRENDSFDMQQWLRQQQNERIDISRGRHSFERPRAQEQHTENTRRNNTYASNDNYRGDRIFSDSSYEGRSSQTRGNAERVYEKRNTDYSSSHNREEGRAQRTEPKEDNIEKSTENKAAAEKRKPKERRRRATNREPSLREQKAEIKRFNKFTKSKSNSGKSNDELRREFAEKTRKRRKRRVHERSALIVLLFAAILTAASLTILFRINEIQVEGETRYSYEEIVSSSGIEMGDNLWRTLFSDSTEKNVSTALPYIGKVKMSYKIPSTLILQPQETTPVYALKKGKRYILVDESDKVLELNSKTPSKSVVIAGVSTAGSAEGMKLSKSTSEKYETAKGIFLCSSDSGIKLKSINVSDLNNIFAVCDKKIRLDFGSSTNIEEKIKMAHEVMNELEAEGSLNEGVINLKSLAKAFYKEGSADAPATTLRPTEAVPVTDENGNEVTSEASLTTDPGTTAESTLVPTESTTESMSQSAESVTESTTAASELATQGTTAGFTSGDSIPEPPAQRPAG